MLEDFLIAQLTDESEAGFSLSSGTRSVDDVRIADLAADRLADFWGDAQAFDFYALLPDRNRQIHALNLQRSLMNTIQETETLESVTGVDVAGPITTLNEPRH